MLLIVGLIAGGIASLFAARAADSLLFGVKPSDPLTIALAVAGLASVGLFAGWLPARRASRLQPTLALREE